MKSKNLLSILFLKCILFRISFAIIERCSHRLKLMKIINQICDESRQERVFHFFKDEFSDPDILATISRLAPDFEDTMVKCRLFDEWTSCDQFFHPTITEAGMCYTFNGLQLKEIATDE